MLAAKGTHASVVAASPKRALPSFDEDEHENTNNASPTATAATTHNSGGVSGMNGVETLNANNDAQGRQERERLASGIDVPARPERAVAEVTVEQLPAHHDHQRRHEREDPCRGSVLGDHELVGEQERERDQAPLGAQQRCAEQHGSDDRA